jgi:hypothetical protein
MHRNNLVACVTLSAGLTAVVPVQAPSPSGTAGQKTIHSITVNVIGCVVAGSGADHYRLINAVLSGDDTASTVGTTGKAGSGRNISFENSPSFDLIGGRANAHAGQTVEVVGITSDTKLNNSDAFSSAIGSSNRERATLTVTSMTMIAPTCR